ncbi:MAG: hypothetical protein KDC46_08195 [Thermoleophilia bacterium]|nr:hypothetical protein [Thermoleophilia bacterium]
MNSHHAAAEIIPTNADLAAAERAELAMPHGAHAPITGWHALHGLPIGILRGLAPGCDVEVLVEQVIEEASDLAVADRVAWILSGRTGRQHVVLAASTGYLVAIVGPELDWAAAMRLEPGEHAPRIVSVANADGVLPVLVPVAG